MKIINDNELLKKLLIEHSQWVTSDGEEGTQLCSSNLKPLLEKHERWLSQSGGKQLDLSKMNLQQSNLSGCNLEKVRFIESNLSGADLSFTILRRCNLRKANLRQANLSYADLTKSSIQRADLIEANLQDAELQNVDFQGADLQGANLEGTNLEYNKVLDSFSNEKNTDNFIASYMNNNSEKNLQRKIMGFSKQIDTAPPDTSENLRNQLKLYKKELAYLDNEIQINIDSAIDRISSSIKETNRAISKNIFSSWLFMVLGLGSYLIGFFILFLDFNSLFTNILGLKNLPYLVYLAPVSFPFIIGTICLRHDKNIRQNYLVLINQKHSIEKATGLLQASRYLDKIDQLDHLKPTVRETFKIIREYLLTNNDSNRKIESKNEISTSHLLQLIKVLTKATNNKSR